MKIIIEQVENPGWDSAMKIKGNIAKIWVDKNDSKKRQKFAIAYQEAILELGKIKEGETSFYVNFMKNPDKEAIDLVYESLIPTSRILTLYRANGPKIKELSDFFEVEERVITNKLSQLVLGKEI